MLRRQTIRNLCAALALMLAACGQASESAKTADAPAPAATEAPSTTPPDPQAEFCAEVGRRVSAADCADLSRLADEAARGSAAFNAPNPMQRGDVHTLQLAISLAPPEDEGTPSTAPSDETPAPSEDAAWAQAQQENTSAAFTEYLEDHSAGTHADEARAALERLRRGPPPATPEDVVDPLQGETVQFTPLVGRFMRVELTGNGFEITPLNEASQEVLQDSVTTWTWRVVAREGGQRSLTLRTVVEGCTADGQCYPLRSTSQNYDVTVQVGPLGQAQDLLTAAPIWLRLAAGVLTGLAALLVAWFTLRNAFRKGRSTSG
jgi:hypothetical protein